VHVFPINNEALTPAWPVATGMLTGGGFEGPAEALFLGKKVLMIPMRGQYEQQCNALSASKLGVEVVHTINHDFASRINNWLADDPA
jgi:uncharacterized protein (TIGR00661 family)